MHKQNLNISAELFNVDFIHIQTLKKLKLARLCFGLPFNYYYKVLFNDAC